MKYASMNVTKQYYEEQNIEDTMLNTIYRKTFNIRRTLVGDKIVDHSGVVGASPVGAAPTSSSFSTQHLASRDSTKTAIRQYEKVLGFGASYIRELTVFHIRISII